MTGPAGDDDPFESTEEKPDYRDDDDRDQWLRENVPPHHN
jgi:hypothetical protein